MSTDHDDFLIEKLQKTIDGWSSEVTDAHQKLTRQIGSAKSQLDTLIGVLGSGQGRRTAAGPTEPANAAAAASPPIIEPKSEPDDSGSAPDSSGRAQATQRELDSLQSSNEELTQEIARRVYENRATASELEIAKKKIEEYEHGAELSPSDVAHLKQEINRKSSELERAQLEIKSLTTAIETFRKEFGMQQAVYEECELEATADLKTAASFIEEQKEEVEELKGQLTTLRLRHEQHAETEEAMKAELEGMRAASLADEKAMTRFRGEIDALNDDLISLNDERDRLRGEEKAMREEAQSLRQEYEEAQREDRHVKEELDSLTLEYDRQGKALAESVKELEAHGKLAEEAQAKEKGLQQQIEEMEAKLSETANAAIRIREDLQSSEAQLDQARHAHTLELENLRIQKQEGIYGVLKTLGEHGLAQGDTNLALELTEKQARLEELGHLNATLSDKVQMLEGRLKDLERSGGLPPGDTGPDRQSAKAEMEKLREELTVFERQLVEREQAIEAAADKMRLLEETAMDVQVQFAALHAEHLVGEASGLDDGDPGEAQREIEALKSNLAEMTGHNYAQAARLQDAEKELAGLRDLGESPESEDQEAAALSKDLPHVLDQALAEIQGLRKNLAERDEEMEALKRRMEEKTTTAEATPMIFAAHDASGQARSMGEILIDAGIITLKQLDSALEEQRTAKKRRLGSILVEKGLIREEIVAQVVGSQLNLPFVRLADQSIEKAALALMDGRLATHHMCFPISATSEKITIAMANPLDLIAIEDLEFATSLKVKPVVATLSDIISAIVQHYGVAIANTIAEDTFESQTPPKLQAKNPTSRARGKR